MIKRLTWFLGGALAGIAGAGIAKRKMKATAARLGPVRVAKSAAQRTRDAMVEGRLAMRAREAELRARRDGRLDTLADELDLGDAVLVEGRQVEPAKVIVLRQFRELPSQRRRRQA